MFRGASGFEFSGDDNENDAVVIENQIGEALSSIPFFPESSIPSSPGNSNVPPSAKLPGNIGTGNTIIVGDINISNAGVLHLGTSFNVTSGLPSKPKKELPASYRSCDTPLNLCLAIFVSKFFTDGHEVSILGKKLGLKTEARSLTMTYSRFGTREVMYQLLMMWISRNNGRALVKDLAEALWKQDKKETVKTLYKFISDHPELLTA